MSPYEISTLEKKLGMPVKQLRFLISINDLRSGLKPSVSQPKEVP